SIELLFGKRYQLPQALTKLWDGEPFTLRDMMLEERENLLTRFLQDKMAELDKVCGRMYYEYEEIIAAISEAGLPVPLELKTLAEHTLSLELVAQVENLKTPADEKSCKKALQIVEKAREFGFQLNKDRVQHLFQQRIEQKVAALTEKMTPALCEEILQLLELAEKLEIPIRENKIQNRLFQILKNKVPPLIDKILLTGNLDSHYELVSCLLRLSYKLNFDISPYKEKLKPLEIKLSQDPRFWP
ncbi:MAG: hypothetical protein ONB05_05405, partial [candidate division KSB1 bacterium]|nr:hypothetical protein [candidate division KSB1 bacterium]